MKKEPQEKRFLQILQEKIFNLESGYEIDKENLNPEELSQKNKTEENADNINDININEEKEHSEKADSFKQIPKNNIKLKESLKVPLEHQNNDEEIPHIVNSDKKIIIPINNEYLQKYTSIQFALCQDHGKAFLKIDPTNFEIVCEKCIEEGKISQLEILNDLNNIDKSKSDNYDDTEEEEKVFNCFEHQNMKGSFYCEDCKQFVCKMCFADIHREHKCHLPKVIKTEFFKYLKDEINNANNLRPMLDDSINDIKKIYDNLKKQKDDLIKIPQNTLKVISLNNDNQIELLKNKTNEKFMGIDRDVNDDYFTFNGIKEKNKKFLEILKNISNEMNMKENNFELCGYHKEKMKLFKEINNFINSSFNFINNKLNNTNLKYIENKEKIENSLNLMNKEISNYEKSCISSISTGRENRAIILLRYVRFVHREIKYFKNTLIAFASNDNIFLTGLVLCGLYIKRKKNKNKNINNNNLEVRDDNNDNNESSNNNEIEQNENKKINIPIQISVYTMVKKAEGDLLFTQKSDLYGVKSDDEPCVIINFDKGIKIKKEKVYLIKVENLSEDNYTDLWTGSVGKVTRKNLQIIKCHNSGIQFLFQQAEGIETDFDEFEQGIIDGVLYSRNQ